MEASLQKSWLPVIGQFCGWSENWNENRNIGRHACIRNVHFETEIFAFELEMWLRIIPYSSFRSKKDASLFFFSQIMPCPFQKSLLDAWIYTNYSQACNHLTRLKTFPTIFQKKKVDCKKAQLNKEIGNGFQVCKIIASVATPRLTLRKLQKCDNYRC